MPRSFSPDIDPTAIGNVSSPPFARLPDPATLFAARRDRLLFLANGSEVAPYLTFLAGLAEAQDAAARDAPRPAPLDPERLERASAHAMPPLDRAGFRRDTVVSATLGRFFDEAALYAMPDAAAAALRAVRAADPDELDIAIGNVLADAIPADTVAEHVFVAAGLQVHFARLAATLDADALKPVGGDAPLCPSCGGPPVSSMVVGWPGSESTRFCACPLCATLWHFVRVRCTACGSTKGVGIQSVEGAPDTVKAETCTECHSYAKVIYQQRDPAAEPVADDVATVGLDMLMKDGPFRRSAFNPFLLGY